MNLLFVKVKNSDNNPYEWQIINSYEERMNFHHTVEIKSLKFQNERIFIWNNLWLLKWLIILLKKIFK